MVTVVTGAAGFVGNNLVRELVAQGRRVRALIYTEAEARLLADLPIEICQADICQPERLPAAFQEAEVVYHLAGYISLKMHDWARCEAVNVIGVRNVVEAALAAGVRRLIHFSSFHALVQEPLHLPVTEQSTLIDQMPDAPDYNRSKALGEREIAAGLAKGLDAVIICPTGMVGPHDYQPSAFGSFLLDLAQGKFPVLLQGGCDFVDVRDVVQGAIMAEKHAPAGEKYLLSGEWHTIQQMDQLVAALTGKRPTRLIMPMPAAMAAARVLRWLDPAGRIEPRLTPASLTELSGNPCVSHAKAAQTWGYQPRPMRATLRDALHWYRENGFLSERIVVA